jgi:hypothetical protein
MRLLFPDLPQFPLDTTNNNTALNSMHNIVEMFTPSQAVLEGVIPPEARAKENPYRFFLNGGDFEIYGEQYGANVYAHKQVVPAPQDLTASDQGDLTIKLEWTNPKDLNPDFTKWAVFKHYFLPEPLSDSSFFSGARRIGEVPISETSFVDDGTNLVAGVSMRNEPMQDMHYRLRAER